MTDDQKSYIVLKEQFKTDDMSTFVFIKAGIDMTYKNTF